MWSRNLAFGPVKCLAPSPSSGQFCNRIQTNLWPISHCYTIDRFVKIKRGSRCKHAVQNVKLSEKNKNLVIIIHYQWINLISDYFCVYFQEKRNSILNFEMTTSKNLRYFIIQHIYNSLHMCVCAKSSSTLCGFMNQLLCPWNFPGKNTRTDCHFLHQGIFPTLEFWTCISYISYIGWWVLYH